MATVSITTTNGHHVETGEERKGFQQLLHNHLSEKMHMKALRRVFFLNPQFKCIFINDSELFTFTLEYGEQGSELRILVKQKNLFPPKMN